MTIFQSLWKSEISSTQCTQAIKPINKAEVPACMRKMSTFRTLFSQNPSSLILAMEKAVSAAGTLSDISSLEAASASEIPPKLGGCMHFTSEDLSLCFLIKIIFGCNTTEVGAETLYDQLNIPSTLGQFNINYSHKLYYYPNWL